MADPRQLYHGWEAKAYGPNRYAVCRRNNLFYWRLDGRAWFYFLRQGPRHHSLGRSRGLRLVFDMPMAAQKRRRAKQQHRAHQGEKEWG